LSRKKSHSNANNSNRSELSLFQGGRSFQSGLGRENLENQKQLHMPGYTGHVPKATSALGPGPQGDSRNPADKSLLAENYRHNVVGYTGHVK